MQLNDYDTVVQDTNLMGNNTLYHLLGLISELGEVAAHVSVENETVQELLNLSIEQGRIAGNIKRQMRDEGIEYRHNVDIIPAQSEMRDVYWYVSTLNASVVMSSENTVQNMIAKLQDRKNRDMLRGSGDNR
jgi:hypothetical protein